MVTVSSAEERRTLVLRAIVADFIASHEPVGSKALVEKHNLGVSSATIRNDMTVLETEGYIAQPHTSSGRVPTEKGYRHFVDSLKDVKPLSVTERRTIQGFLEDGVDLDDVLRRAVRLLSQLTRQVAVIQYPQLTRATVRHLELVSLTPARLLLVLITDTGRVDQRTVDLAAPIAEDALVRLRTMLGSAAADKSLVDAAAAVEKVCRSAPIELREVASRVASVLMDSLVGQPDQRLILGGTANLTRNAGDFEGSLRPVLEALEEQVVVLKLLEAAQRIEAAPTFSEFSGVTVQIGTETHAEQMRGAAVVCSSYGADDAVLGGMGVLGPARMDYPGTIASVAAVAHYVGEILVGN